MFALHPLSTATRDRLIATGLDPDALSALIRLAIAEDLMGGIDVTSNATIPSEQRSVATFGAREDGVVAGLPVVAAVIETVCGGDASDVEYLVDDAERVRPGTEVARVAAPTRLLLTAERTALNLLCHLSGIASLTRQWADALDGTSATVRDTRKTTPGLRALEKYAVRCGGGVNHRMGLSDMALVKDNHVVAAGGITEAFERVDVVVGAGEDGAEWVVEPVHEALGRPGEAVVLKEVVDVSGEVGVIHAQHRDLEHFGGDVAHEPDRAGR